MFPALIPEKHPMCGKYMKELIRCREEAGWSRYTGVCNDAGDAVLECLALEKKVLRAPRAQKFQEKWAQRKAEAEERMNNLQEQIKSKEQQVGGAAQGDGSCTNCH